MVKRGGLYRAESSRSTDNDDWTKCIVLLSEKDDVSLRWAC